MLETAQLQLIDCRLWKQVSGTVAVPVGLMPYVEFLKLMHHVVRIGKVSPRQLAEVVREGQEMDRLLTGRVPE